MIEDHWYRDDAVARLLAPVAALFCGLVRLRRAAYRRGWLRAERAPVPVVVVGNITVGGTGKTPLVVWLTERLARAGYRPGVVSRGHGGQGGRDPEWVASDSPPERVGDEPVLIAARTGRPVVVAADRPAAIRHLLEHTACDCVVADDGLQHYRMARDVEIAVVDGRRRLGNGRCLPAGPLREPAARLDEVDFVVANGAPGPGEVDMDLEAEDLVNLADPYRRMPLSDLADGPVHAVAGIGHPERFFRMLGAAGMEVIGHPFPDHHRFQPRDLDFGDGRPVVMTQKDAVKCRAFAHAGQWYLPVAAVLPEGFGERVVAAVDAARRYGREQR